MNVVYDLCKYYNDCVISQNEDKDCIYYEDCQVKKFYDKYGRDYLQFSLGTNVGIVYEINSRFNKDKR